MTDDELALAWRAHTDTLPTSMTTDAVTAATARFAKRIARRNAREWIAATLVVVFFAWRALVEPSKVIALGAAMIALAAIVVSITLRRRGRPTLPPPPDAATSEHLAHHRAELVRQRDLLASAWRWYVAPFLPGFVLWFAGFGLRMPRHHVLVAALALGICVPVFVGIAVLNRVAAKKISRAISLLETS